jgi:hypothetical protein
MYIADTLSRAYLKDLPNDNESNIEGVNMLSDLPIYTPTFDHGRLGIS